MKGRSPAQAAANQPGDARAGCSSRSFTTPANGPLVHRSLFDEDVTGMPDLEGRNLIDELMPHWERRILRAQPVNAPPERTFAAIRKVDFLRSPVIVAPHRLRVDLDRMIRPRSHDAPPRRREFRFAQLVEEEGGFRLLAEEDGHELVLGFIGRWWERGYGRVAWTADEFSEFARPGYAVGAWGFTVVPYGAESCILVTDVRVRCTDDEARRKFNRYWTLVARFVTAMGRPVLRLIRDEAEATSGHGRAVVAAKSTGRR
jgi:hypothetical protein